MIDHPVHQLYFSGGISFPTGSIDETGDTPRGKNTPVPYTMQIGSGTYDLQPGILYTGHDGDLTWGAEFSTKFRVGRNKKNYSLGDRGAVSAWIKKWLPPGWSPVRNLRLSTGNP